MKCATVWLKPNANDIQGSLSTSTSVRNLEDEAVEALIALGYKPAQASQMVSKFSSPDLSVEEIIRKALKASLS